MRLIAWLVAISFVAAGCGNGECRSRNDCGDGEFCFGPNGGPVCGIGPREGCSAGDQCFGDQTCNVIVDGCSLDGVGSECGAACTADSCGATLRCNADGACEAIPCDEGFDCPEHQVCDPSSITATTPVFDRHHGCVNVECGGDGDCPETQFCVNSICQVGVGSCQEPMAVP